MLSLGPIYLVQGQESVKGPSAQSGAQVLFQGPSGHSRVQVFTQSGTYLLPKTLPFNFYEKCPPLPEIFLHTTHYLERGAEAIRAKNGTLTHV